MKLTIPRSADYSLYRTVSRLKNVSEREDITVEQLKPFINKLAELVCEDANLDFASINLGFVPPSKSFDDMGKEPIHKIVSLKGDTIMGKSGMF